MTIRQLAEQSGLTFPTVVSIETRKSVPSLESLTRIAAALDMSAAGLLLLCQQKNVLKNRADLIKDLPENGTKYCRVAAYGDTKVFLIKGDAGEQTGPLRQHGEVFEFCYTLSGQVEVTTDSQKHVLQRNDTLFYDGQIDHTYRFLSESKIIVFHIPKDPFSLHGIFGTVPYRLEDNSE